MNRLKNLIRYVGFDKMAKYEHSICNIFIIKTPLLILKVQDA